MSEIASRVNEPSKGGIGGINRRQFLKAAGGALAATAAPIGMARGAASTETSKTPESYVKLLYESLTEKQRGIMHFKFDHPLRSKVANNWNIVDPEVGAIGKLYSLEQRELIRSALQGILTEDGYERFLRQMKDDSGGFEKYTCAIFGRPGEDKFQWVMTGRHLTIRADGDSVENSAFGGPIFYGHAVEGTERPDHPGNVWWHQARLANKVYESLDGEQRKKGLLKKAPPDSERTIAFRAPGEPIPGLACAELSGDQKENLEKTLKGLLSMFRKSDVDEVMECLKKNGGVEGLHISFYQQGDLGKDGIWDRWRVEGPAFIWYFRGSPHVHTWVNVAHSARA